MLLQRIKLKGFLGHRGSTGGNGEADFVEVDFSSAPLWLVHGANGSGKSSLWDAITFAFFKKHRATGTDGGKNLKHLIHDECDKAEIVVEFDLGSQQFRVCSEINKPRRKNGSASTNRIVQRWSEGDWETVADGEQRVEVWLDKNLRMSYETFTSAVLLRQGEADVFLRAKPKDRRTRLMELLRLDFYRKLGDRATSKRNESKKKCDELQQDFNNLPTPSDEDLAAQRGLIESLQQSLDELKVNRESKDKELWNAQQAASLLEQIEGCEAQHRADKSLFEHQESIEAAARRYRDLEGVLHSLETLWDARHQLDDEDGRLKEGLAKAVVAEEYLRDVSETLTLRRDEEQRADDAVQENRRKFNQAQQHYQEALRRSEILKCIEGIERDVNEEEKRLLPYQSVLSQRERIERAYARHKELHEAVSLLRPLATTNERLLNAQEQIVKAQSEVEQHEARLHQANDEEERLRQAVEEAEEERERVRADSDTCRIELNSWRDTLKRRNEVNGKDECPYCGSTLSDDEAKGRLAQEHVRWHEKVSQLENRESQLEQLLKDRTESFKNAQKNLRATEQTSSTLLSELEGSRRDLEHAKAAVTNAEQELKQSRGNAGKWADRLDDLADLENELASLKNAEVEWCKLDEALRKEAEVSAATAIYHRRLAELQDFSPAERQQIRLEAETCEQIAVVCRQEMEIAEAAYNNVNQTLRELVFEHVRLKAEFKAEQGRAGELQQRQQEAQEKYEQKRRDIPCGWADHPACEDESELLSLKCERDSLRGAEAKSIELGAARERKSKLEERISTLQEQLEPIPTGHRRPVEVVRTELQEIVDEITRTGGQLRQLEDHLAELQRQRLAVEEKRKERAVAERDNYYFSRLTEALGKKGLEAFIVQKAQEEIKLKANKTLSHLSSGCLEIDLEDKSDSEELQIQARDMNTGNLRLFEYLSGGEKFRVAISLAVAIGQSVSGERTVETLVIDEGFGALDEDNRGLLVKELSLLTEAVLCGGRVIVVSHQENVCGEFANWYRVAKDKDGYVQIESSATD